MSQQFELTAVVRTVADLQGINQLNGSLTNVARMSNQTTTQMAGGAGLLTREWEKFRRTFGYAVAGMATYKIFQAYQNLVQYNAELGQINAMLPNLGSGLQQFGNVALQVSSRTGAPLQDVMASIQNIIQSIPNMSAATRQHLVPAMAEIEAMASRITDVDPRSFGSTVLALATQFHGRQGLANPVTGPKILERIASQLITTRYTTPALTGQDLVNYIRTATQGAVASGFTLPQALAMFTVVQRSIGRPSQSAQYLRQLFLRIRVPTHAEAPYFAQAGLGQQQLANMSGMQILNQLIRHGMSLPGGATPGQLNHAMTTGDWQRINVKGEAAEFFRKAIGGRIQSLVAISALVRNLGQVSLQMQTLQKGSSSLQSEFDRFASQNKLQIMSNALSNATTDVLYNFMPGLNLGATALTSIATYGMNLSNTLRGVDRHVNNFVLGNLVGSQFAKRHNILGGALDVGLTTGGIMALMRSPKLIGRLLGRLGGRFGTRIAEGEVIQKTFGAYATAETPQAAVAALSNQANGTPSAPFWVVIHPLSKSTVPGLFGGGGGGGSTATKIEKDVGKVAAARALLRSAATRYGGRLAAGGAILGAELPALPDIIKTAMGGDPFGAKAKQNMQQMMKEGYSATLARYFTLTKDNKLIPRQGTPAWMNRALQSSRDKGGLLGWLGLGGEHDINEGRATRTINDIMAGKRPNTFLQSPQSQQRHQQQQQHLRTLSKNVARVGQISNQRNMVFAPGVFPEFMPSGEIDATFTLVPTQELKGLLHPVQVRAKVPVSLWNKSSSPPSERGKAKTTRNRGG